MKTLSLTTLIAATLFTASLTATVSASPNRTTFTTLSPNALASVQTLRPGIHLLRPSLDCTVAGQPVEFPNDLRIRSDFGIAAGTAISWSIPGTNLSGTAILPAIPAGQPHFIMNVFAGGISPTNCLASVL